MPPAYELSKPEDQDRPKSWRDVLPVHPAAELFPMLSREELIALGQDIQKNGLISKLALWEAEKGATIYLLDGRNRLDAMEAIGLPVLDADGKRLDWKVAMRSVQIRGDDPYAYALSANIHRRHLTAEQRRDLIAKVLKAKPETSNLQIAKQVKADDKTVAKVRTELESRSEIPNVKNRSDSKGRKQPARKPKAAAKQEVFESPQEAHAAAVVAPKSTKPLSKKEMRDLKDSWLTVHERITRGTLSQLKDALEIHRDKIDRVLEHLQA